MAYHGWSRSLYLRERGHSTRNRLQTLGSQLRNSPDRSECLGTQNRKCPARPGPPGPRLLAQGLQAPDCSPRASRPPAARPGPPSPRLLAPGLQSVGCSPRASTPCAVSYHGSSGLKPLPVPERNGSVFPHSFQTIGSLLRNLRGWMEKWETQNPTQPLQGLCSKPKNQRRHMPES